LPQLPPSSNRNKSSAATILPAWFAMPKNNRFFGTP
jgi:hypothetical protein